MLIRNEQPEDRAAIHVVVKAAFGRTDEAVLVDRLRGDGSVVISLVAFDDDAVVGHILLTRMEAPFTALALAPLAVLPDRQGMGIGSRLVHAALQYAKSAGWQAVFVLGDPEYYSRFGFNVSMAAGFSSPYAGPYLMVLPLSGALPASAGAITYAGPFASLSQAVS